MTAPGTPAPEIKFNTAALNDIAAQLTQSAASLEHPKSQCDTISGYVQGGAQEFVGTYSPNESAYQTTSDSLQAVTALMQTEISAVIDQLKIDATSLSLLSEAHTQDEAKNTTTVEAIDAKQAGGTYT